MMTIVRKRQRRRAIYNKDGAFRVRGREVEATKIDRFIKRQATTNKEPFSVTGPAACEPTLEPYRAFLITS